MDARWRRTIPHTADMRARERYVPANELLPQSWGVVEVGEGELRRRERRLMAPKERR